MAHSLGGMYDLPQEECNGLMVEPVIRFNWPAAGDRYSELADVLDIPRSRLSSAERCEASVPWIRTRAYGNTFRTSVTLGGGSSSV